MEIIAAIGLALGAILLAMAVVEIVVLTIGVLIDWFDEIQRTRTLDANEVGFLIEEGERNGKVQYIQGVFNRRTGEITDGRRIAASERDAEVTAMQDGKPLVIFN